MYNKTLVKLKDYLMKILFMIFVTTITLFATLEKDDQKIDDWDYNATTQISDKKINRAMPMSTMASSPVMKMKSESIGFSVGGAKDADNFYENIKNEYLPKLNSITYEGVFYDHYFELPKNSSCESLFCPSYTTFKRENPFTKKDEYFLSVGLESNIKESDFKRKKLNIVVVLDISGSMSSSFDKYYYDKKEHNKRKEPDLSKMQIANKSLVNMIEHLKDEDRLGVVLFDNKAYKAKPLRLVKNTDINATKKHILDLKSRGGTNWSEGYKSGLTLFEKLEPKLKDPQIYENRVIFLTDAMPNRGELSEKGLFGLVDSASQNGIYTTFIGIGVDFNNDLVEAISKTKGANYFSVHSDIEFAKRLDEEFDFMVTPLVFDLSLTLTSNKIEAIYGTPDAKRSNGKIMYVNTLFPSKNSDHMIKGGIILIKVTDIKNLNLSVSYKDRTGKSYKNSQHVTFETESKKDKNGIKKAILLSDYVTLMQNWMLDMRADCQDKVTNIVNISLEKRAFIYPPDREHYEMIETWERKSCSLKVSEGYKKLLTLFRDDFKQRGEYFKDDKFEKELNALDILLSSKEETKNIKIDDWDSKR